jgi:anti-sigma B factor antagonist
MSQHAEGGVCSTSITGAKALVTLQGDIDVLSVAELRRGLEHCLDAGCTDLTVDLSLLQFIDSSGMGALASAIKRLDTHGGRLKLRQPSPIVRRIIEVMGFSEFVDVVDLDERSAS